MKIIKTNISINFKQLIALIFLVSIVSQTFIIQSGLLSESTYVLIDIDTNDIDHEDKLEDTRSDKKIELQDHISNQFLQLTNSNIIKTKLQNSYSDFRTEVNSPPPKYS